MNLGAPALDADLWGPVLVLIGSVLGGVFVLLAIAIGICMVTAAPGQMFNIRRHLDRIKVGKWFHRIGISILAIASGIGAELHFAPYLLLDPEQAGLGVLAGLAAIIGGEALLTKNRRKGPPKGFFVMTAVVTLVLVGGCAVGNAAAEVAG